jgi:hypothetical protein
MCVFKQYHTTKDREIFYQEICLGGKVAPEMAKLPQFIVDSSHQAITDFQNLFLHIFVVIVKSQNFLWKITWQLGYKMKISIANMPTLSKDRVIYKLI